MDKDTKKSKIKISKKKKIAFVCSGGAAKAGAFHLGVALALQEKGFKFIGGLKRESAKTADPANSPNDTLTMSNSSGREISIYVGSSAGSIICSFLAAGYTLEQIFDSFLGKKTIGPNQRILKRISYSQMFSLKNDEGFLSAIGALTESAKIPAFGKFISLIAKDSYEGLFKWKWLKRSGIFSTAGIEKYLREDVLPSNDFQSFEPDLFLVATQLNHSRKVVFGKYRYTSEDKTVSYINDTRISEAAAASTALPLVFSPFPIKNDKGNKVYYFDGEIRDTLSTHVGYDAGADLIIASYTHQPYHFAREIGSLHDHGIPSIMIQALYLLIERKIQSSIETHYRNEIAIDAVSQFFKEQNLSNDLRVKCLDMLERKLGFKQGVDFIYIHPKAKDNLMFFGDHFNLSPKKMSDVVRLGFRCAIDVFRRYEFE